MKITIHLFFLLLTFLSFSQNSEKEGKSEINFYGEQFSISEESVELTKGQILSSCPNKGCWVKVTSGMEELFVTFKDYSFFVPKNGITGKDIIIKGSIEADTISVAQLKHYASDAGKTKEEISKIKNPQITKSIVADGVAIIN
tara:strand:- start:2554 stop:2982 length:429 start_codon:yes stop_codon:yes gene_type:complete